MKRNTLNTQHLKTQLPTNTGRLGRVILTSNNDNCVRLFDAATLAPKARVAFPYAANFASLRPERGAPGAGALAAVAGDDPAIALVDLLSGQVAGRLIGHRDYAFAAAWHPGGTLLATGNQDGTSMVWDLRSPGGALSVLPARLGAVRALRWSPDGSLLVAAEPADFVHVYEMRRDGLPLREQELDLFGEISGVALSPCGGALFVGVSDPTYSSVLQFQRRRRRPGAAPFGGGGYCSESDDDDSCGEAGDGDGGPAGAAAAAAAAAGRRARRAERRARRRRAGARRLFGASSSDGEGGEGRGAAGLRARRPPQRRDGPVEWR